ncbi:YopX family protein [Streptococcus marmotae]|uniref:YopX family protein n=1 Tax=Streptococcus marmotae TaxID=1825069 RepID=UPI00082D4422|nr:YopX family protein [Streptococcus marmotae]QBX16905.1 hypothetical protein Javan291_0029 [Streptococcus phage Javan291]
MISTREKNQILDGLDFRVYNGLRKTMRPVRGFLKKDDGEIHVSIGRDSSGYNTVPLFWENPDGVRQAYLMKYTGLRDFRNKKIYEGDILEEPDSGFRFEVKFRKDRPVVYYKGKYSDDLAELNRLMRVVGNIYQNKELLEVEE